MKKVLILIFLSINIYAENLQIPQDVIEFYENRGYERGKEEGLKLAKEIALKEFEKSLNIFFRDLQAYYVGAKISKEQNILAPKILKYYNDSGDLSISIANCRVDDKLLTIKDIILAPQLENINNQTNFIETSNNEITNSFVSINSDNSKTTSKDYYQKNYVSTFENTSYVRNMLSNENIKYNLSADKQLVTASFLDETQYKAVIDGKMRAVEIK